MSGSDKDHRDEATRLPPGAEPGAATPTPGPVGRTTPAPARAGEPLPATKPAPLPAKPVGMIGREVGPYRIVAELGAGGMGAVYLADQFQPVRRQVALKLIHAGMESADLVARFQSERDLLARMNHPNIAQVLDVGTADDGRLYFAMEYVPGVPLQVFCDRRGMNARQRLELFLQVCEGVQHAHQKGVIHRDLKPANLLVADYDGRWIVKVIDFGIAKAVDAFGQLEPGTTRAGTPIGTPAYMSPEQARGDAASVDTRTDVYALGGVLYRLLTDTSPVPEEVLSRTTGIELARTLEHAVIPAPSQRVLDPATTLDSDWNRRMANDPRAHARLLRGDLDWITLKALSHERERRYASVSELAADVQRHLNGEPVLASPPGRLYRIGKFVRRHRAAVAAGAAVMVALVAGIVGTSWMAMEARAQRDRAEAALAEAQAERDRATAVSGFLETMIAAPDPWKLQGARIDAREVRVLDVLGDAVSAFEARRVEQPALYASIGTLLGGTLRRLGDLAQARSVLEQAAADAAATRPEGDPERLAVSVELALAQHALGELEAADAQLSRVVGDPALMAALDPALRAEVRRSAAQVALDRGDAARAEALARDNLAATIAEDGEDSTAASGARYSLAWILGAGGQWEEADALAQAAWQAERRRLGPAHPVTVQLLGGIGALALRRGDYDEAERRYREALLAAEQVLGADHPQTLYLQAHVATAMDNGGDHEGAVALFAEVLPRYAEAVGEDNPEVLLMRANHAIALRAAGRLDEAAAEFEQLLALRRRVLGETHPETVRTMMFLAAVARDRGQLDRAEVLLGQAASLYAEINGPDHPETLVMENNHLSIVRDRGDLDRAIAGYAALLPRAEAALPADHWHLAAIRGNYAVSLYRDGRFDQAAPLLASALATMRAQFGEDDPRRRQAEGRAAEFRELSGRDLPPGT